LLLFTCHLPEPSEVSYGAKISRGHDVCIKVACTGGLEHPARKTSITYFGRKEFKRFWNKSGTGREQKMPGFFLFLIHKNNQ
jgi:hypothetical protein